MAPGIFRGAFVVLGEDTYGMAGTYAVGATAEAGT